MKNIFTDRWGNTLIINDSNRSNMGDSCFKAPTPIEKDTSKIGLFFLESMTLDESKKTLCDVPWFATESEADSKDFIKDLGRIVQNNSLMRMDVNDVVTIARGEEINTMLYVTGMSMNGSLKEALHNAVTYAKYKSFDIFKSKKLLIAINLNDDLSAAQMKALDDFLGKFGNEFEYKWGAAKDHELPEGAVRVVVVANIGDFPKTC